MLLGTERHVRLIGTIEAPPAQDESFSMAVAAGAVVAARTYRKRPVVVREGRCSLGSVWGQSAVA